MFADDATQYCSGTTVDAVKKKIQTDLQPILQWNHENKMLLNEEKNQGDAHCFFKKAL